MSGNSSASQQQKKIVTKSKPTFWMMKKMCTQTSTMQYVTKSFRFWRSTSYELKFYWRRHWKCKHRIGRTTFVTIAFACICRCKLSLNNCLRLLFVCVVSLFFHRWNANKSVDIANCVFEWLFTHICYTVA